MLNPSEYKKEIKAVGGQRKVAGIAKVSTVHLCNFLNGKVPRPSVDLILRIESAIDRARLEAQRKAA